MHVPQEKEGSAPHLSLSESSRSCGRGRRRRSSCRRTEPRRGRRQRMVCGCGTGQSRSELGRSHGRVRGGCRRQLTAPAIHPSTPRAGAVACFCPSLAGGEERRRNERSSLPFAVEQSAAVHSCRLPSVQARSALLGKKETAAGGREGERQVSLIG